MNSASKLHFWWFLFWNFHPCLVNPVHAWSSGLSDVDCIHDECSDGPAINTHLRVVNQALEHIRQAGQANATLTDFANDIYNRMNDPGCRFRWEEQLSFVDRDDVFGKYDWSRHYYNPTKTDYYGIPTKCRTYRLWGLFCLTKNGDAKGFSNTLLETINDIWYDDKDCGTLGRVLHFVTDLTTGLHAKGQTSYFPELPLEFHGSWEGWVARRQTETTTASDMGLGPDVQLPQLTLGGVVTDPNDALELVAHISAVKSAPELRAATHSWPFWTKLFHFFIISVDKIPSTPEMVVNADYLLARAYYLTAYYIWTVFQNQPPK